MKKRKIPMRRDLLTNEMVPKKDLVRIVLDKEGNLSIDPTGKKPGRGAYVSLNPENIQTAKDKQALSQSLKVKVDDAFYQELFEYVDHQKARQELFGDQK